MNIEELRSYCLSKAGVTEDLPFGPELLVFKVMGKLFLLTSLTFRPFRVNLKMEPELVGEYRDKYVDVQPGYHMNKKYWNSVYMENGTIPRKELLWMIDHSYEQVVKGLSKKAQEELNRIK
jgi:predicted DNA-binding protein (MmcQ/YjbR family)